MAPKKDKFPSKKKDKYRICTWKQHNQSLANRGSITFWFDEEVIAKWYSVKRSNKPGRPETYSDDAIACALVLMAIFRMRFVICRDFCNNAFLNCRSA